MSGAWRCTDDRNDLSAGLSGDPPEQPDDATANAAAKINADTALPPGDPGITDLSVRTWASPARERFSATGGSSTKLAGVAAAPTMYERVGGREFFDALTRRFYDAVAVDPVLRPLYPDDPEEFERAREHLRDFLVQYWGGPETYNETRGAPRLRQRHVPFAIGTAERDAWLTHMTDSVRAASMHPLDEAQMLGYFNSAAAALTNRP